MHDIFDQGTCEALVARINRLNADSSPQWGKMNAARMLAHCNKPYDTLYDDAYRRANPPAKGVKRVLLNWFVKPLVTGPKPYPRNTRTAPSYVVADQRDLEVERAKLIGYIRRVQSLGAGHFEGKPSHSFGPLSAREWSVLFHKHLDHHLRQFGV